MQGMKNLNGCMLCSFRQLYGRNPSIWMDVVMLPRKEPGYEAIATHVAPAVIITLYKQ